MSLSYPFPFWVVTGQEGNVPAVPAVLSFATGEADTAWRKAGGVAVANSDSPWVHVPLLRSRGIK